MNYREQLIDNILPFWLNNAIDYENGGIFTCLDREGVIYGREKSVWFQGRALWTFSKAYNTIKADKEYLKAAKCIYDFLPKCTDTDGRMFFTVTADGREINPKKPWKLGVYEGGGYVDKGVYRPWPNCMMNWFHRIDVYCPVCQHEIQQTIDMFTE